MEALKYLSHNPNRKHICCFSSQCTLRFVVHFFFYDEWLSRTQIYVSTIITDLGPYLSRLSLVLLRQARCHAARVMCKSKLRLHARPSWMLFDRERCLFPLIDTTPVEDRGLPACWPSIIYHDTKEGVLWGPYRVPCWRGFRIPLIPVDIVRGGGLFVLADPVRKH